MRPKHKKDKKGQRRKNWWNPPKSFRKSYKKSFRQKTKKAIRTGEPAPEKEDDSTWDWI